MTRITVDIDDALLHEAQGVLGTSTKVATLNEALREVVHRRRVAEAIDAMNSVEMDYSGSARSFRYGGGRDLDKLAEKAREAAATDRESA